LVLSKLLKDYSILFISHPFLAAFFEAHILVKLHQLHPQFSGLKQEEEGHLLILLIHLNLLNYKVNLSIFETFLKFVCFLPQFLRFNPLDSCSHFIKLLCYNSTDLPNYLQVLEFAYSDLSKHFSTSSALAFALSVVTLHLQNLASPTTK